MKNVFIVSSSLRKNANSDLLAEEFARGAKLSGNTVDKINLSDIDLKFCTGCMYCQNHAKCALTDDMNRLYSQIQTADVLVFATPIYFYEMAGQLKTFLDRLNPLFTRNNSFKEVYILATAADGDKSAMDGAIKGISGWIECFDGVKLAATVCGVGVEKAGEIKTSQTMYEAFELGKSL